MADPFIVPSAVSPPQNHVANASSIFHAPKAMLSELIRHERASTRLSKRTSPRDVLAPKHAGITKSSRRTPLSARFDRNARMSSKDLSGSSKRSSRRREARTIAKRPDHPLFRRYEDATANYQNHIAADLPTKLVKAKQSIDNHLSYILTATQESSEKVQASVADLFVPLDEIELNIMLQETGQVYTQSFGKRFEEFQATVSKQREVLSALGKRHEDVLARLDMLKRNISKDTDIPEQNGDSASYTSKAQEIPKRYQSEREKVLARFQKNKATLLGRVNAYEAHRKKQKMEADKVMRMYQDTLAKLLNEEDGVDDDD